MYILTPSDPDDHIALSFVDSVWYNHDCETQGGGAWILNLHTHLFMMLILQEFQPATIM